jgi:hypothetical protein
MHGSVRAMRARALRAPARVTAIDVALGLGVVGIGFLIGQQLGRWWKSRQETTHTLH